MNDILVPISFSEVSGNSLIHASLIAKQYGATLHLLHCYPFDKYNREYDFGEETYETGIEKKLKAFYQQQVGRADQPEYTLNTCTGPVSGFIAKHSQEYDLLILSRAGGLPSKSASWLSDKIFYFLTKARCPLLLLSTTTQEFSFSGLGETWHIKRQNNEEAIVAQQLKQLGISGETVATKSFEQETFVSAFWRNIVTFSKHPRDAALKDLQASFEKEKIDLLILVNHRKGLFENFLKEDAFQMLSRFDIPILIFQANNN